MKHLTQDQLIRQQFQLADAAEAKLVHAHLDGCEQCRERLAGLQRKFASLELLREAPGASEALVEQTLAQLGEAGVGRRPWYRGRAWLGVAASLLAALAGWAAYEQFYGAAPVRPAKQQVTRHDAAESVTPEGADSYEYPMEEELVARADEPKDAGGTPGKSHRTTVTSEPLAAADAGPKRTIGPDRPPAVLGAAGAGKMIATEDHGQDAHATKRGQDARDTAEGRIMGGTPMPQEDQPPFAPASNIELVTLPRREGVQLTVYNGADLTLVRERRKLTLKRGWNWLQFAWENTLIDPTSLYLEPQAQRDKIHVEQLVYPPRLQQIGRWLIKSEVAGAVPFEITYFTSGVAWRAFYMGTLSADEGTMQLEGYVRVDNHSGEDYADAQTRLVVGKVHLLDRIAELAKRQYAYGRPPGLTEEDEDSKHDVSLFPDNVLFSSDWGWRKDMGGMGGGMGAMGGDMNLDLCNARWFRSKPKEIVKEGLSEYFLYTIEGTETIPDGWAKRLGSLKADDVEVVNLYKYEEEMYGQSVVRFLSFTNDEEHKLGETPIPGGMLKVYRSVDEAGYLSYEGQSEFKYIPVNEDVELNLGAVENVIVKPTLMNSATDNYCFDRDDNIIGYDEIARFKVAVKNTRDLPIKVEIKRNFGTPYWSLQRGGDFAKYEKVDADTVRFTLRLDARSTQIFEYTLTKYHGVRQEENK